MVGSGDASGGPASATRAGAGRARALRAAAARCAARLYAEHGATGVYLFGSAARRGPIHDRSDLDLAVAGLAPERYVHALADLWALLPPGVELDLVPLEQAGDSLVGHVQTEGQFLPSAVCGADARGPAPRPDPPEVCDPVEEDGDMATLLPDGLRMLRADVERELADLHRLASELADLLNEVAATPRGPRSVELRAAAGILHDFYTAIERLLRRVAVALDGGLPAGPDWHVQLLRRMGAPMPEARPALLDEPLAARLAEYLRFRHLVRNTYGFLLDWSRLLPLAQQVPEVLAQVEAHWQAFAAQLAGRDHGSHGDAGQPT